MYTVVRATFADGDTEATYEELAPNRAYTELAPRLADFKAAPRNFFELLEFMMASLVVPAAADIAAAVDYLAIETALLPGLGAAADWQQAVNVDLEDIQVASIATYADKTLVLDADIAPLGPCRLAFYTALGVLTSPADGGDSVWYIVLKQASDRR